MSNQYEKLHIDDEALSRILQTVENADLDAYRDRPEFLQKERPELAIFRWTGLSKKYVPHADQRLHDRGGSSPHAAHRRPPYPDKFRKSAYVPGCKSTDVREHNCADGRRYKNPHTRGCENTGIRRCGNADIRGCRSTDNRGCSHAGGR